MDIEARQIALEQEAIGLGAVRYRKEQPMPWRAEASKRKETDMPPGQKLLKEALEPLAKAIEDFMRAAGDEAKPGRRHTVVRLLEGVEPMHAAYVTARALLNATAHEAFLQVTLIRLANTLLDGLNYRKLQELAPGMARVLDRKLASGTSEANRRYYEKDAMRIAHIETIVWSTAEKVSLGGKLLELFIESTGLVQIGFKPVGRNKRRRVVKPTAACEAWLKEQHARCELLSPVCMPMVVQPIPWQSQTGGGYLSAGIRLPFVKGSRMGYIGEMENVDMQAVYDAVNHIQSTPWRINHKVLNVLKVIWDRGGQVAKLPSREPLPLPPLPCASEDVPEFKKTSPALWSHWKNRARLVHRANDRQASKRLTVMEKIWMAEKFVNEEAIYFPHQVDFRGRVYASVPILNPQVHDSGKALLEFAEGVELGEDGGFWLAVHLAGLFGIDKVSLQERVQWVLDHEEAILDSGVDPLGGQQFWTQADSPFFALAACFDWVSFKWHGDKHVSHLPVSLDGTCSGLQHYSAMLLDEQGAAVVNLVPSAQPSDIYSIVAQRVQALVDQDESPEAKPWKEGKVTRAIAKQPTMTYCYSATRFGMQHQVDNKLTELDEEARNESRPPYLDGVENFEAARYLSHLLMDAIGEVVSAAERGMEWLRQVAKLTAALELPIYWQTPIGFPVRQEYHKARGKRYVFRIGGRPMMLYVAGIGSKIDQRKQVASIAPNWVHSLDASHLMSVALLAEERGINHLSLVHDSFGTHAGNVELLGALVRRSFVDQYRNDVLAALHQQVAAQLPPELASELPPAPARGKLDIEAVLDADFCFS